MHTQFLLSCELLTSKLALLTSKLALLTSKLALLPNEYRATEVACPLPACAFLFTLYDKFVSGFVLYVFSSSSTCMGVHHQWAQKLVTTVTSPRCQAILVNFELWSTSCSQKGFLVRTVLLVVRAVVLAEMAGSGYLSRYRLRYAGTRYRQPWQAHATNSLRLVLTGRT